MRWVGGCRLSDARERQARFAAEVRCVTDGKAAGMEALTGRGGEERSAIRSFVPARESGWNQAEMLMVQSRAKRRQCD